MLGSQNTGLSVSLFLCRLRHKFREDELSSQYHYLPLKELAIPEHLISNPELNSNKTSKSLCYQKSKKEIEPEVPKN